MRAEVPDPLGLTSARGKVTMTCMALDARRASRQGLVHLNALGQHGSKEEIVRNKVSTID